MLKILTKNSKSIFLKILKKNAKLWKLCKNKKILKILKKLQFFKISTKIKKFWKFLKNKISENSENWKKKIHFVLKLCKKLTFEKTQNFDKNPKFKNFWRKLKILNKIIKT